MVRYLIGLLAKRERAITDNSRFITGCIARIALSDKRGVQAMSTGGKQQSVDWRRPTGLLMKDDRVQCKDGVRSFGIHAPSLIVGQVVREVTTDHDQGFVAAPKQLKHFGDLFWRRATDGQREQRETLRIVSEYALQEWKLDLKRMLLSMSGVVEDNLRQALDGVDRQLIDGHDAEWRLESSARRER